MEECHALGVAAALGLPPCRVDICPRDLDVHRRSGACADQLVVQDTDPGPDVEHTFHRAWELVQGAENQAGGAGRTTPEVDVELLCGPGRGEVTVDSLTFTTSRHPAVRRELASGYAGTAAQLGSE